MTYTVEVASTGIRDLDRINPRITPAIVEFLYGPLAQTPHRVGKALKGDLEGLYGARRGDYRVLYRIDNERTVTVIRISHRSDAYRPR